MQSPPKGATIPYRPKPQVGGPVILAGGQAYTIQGNYAVPAHADVSNSVMTTATPLFPPLPLGHPLAGAVAPTATPLVPLEPLKNNTGHLQAALPPAHLMPDVSFHPTNEKFQNKSKKKNKLNKSPLLAKIKIRIKCFSLYFSLIY